MIPIHYFQPLNISPTLEYLALTRQHTDHICTGQETNCSCWSYLGLIPILFEPVKSWTKIYTFLTAVDRRKNIDSGIWKRERVQVFKKRIYPVHIITVTCNVYPQIARTMRTSILDPVRNGCTSDLIWSIWSLDLVFVCSIGTHDWRHSNK